MRHRIRLGSCLNRFVREEDAALSDHDFILKGPERFGTNGSVS